MSPSQPVKLLPSKSGFGSSATAAGPIASHDADRTRQTGTNRMIAPILTLMSFEDFSRLPLRPRMYDDLTTPRQVPPGEELARVVAQAAVDHPAFAAPVRLDRRGAGGSAATGHGRFTPRRDGVDPSGHFQKPILPL